MKEKSTPAQRLQHLRMEQGLSRRELAERLEISIQAVKSYENGLREPSATIMAKLELLFGVSGAYIMGLTDERQLTSSTERSAEAVGKDFSPAERAAQEATAAEQRLVQYYRRLDAQQQDILLGWAASEVGREI